MAFLIGGSGGGGSPDEGENVFPDPPDFATTVGAVSHAFEDWDVYATVGDIPTTNREDGGDPWTTNGTAFQTFDTEDVDPWFGAKAVTIDLSDSPAEGQAHGRAFVLESFLNAESADDCLVFEWAWRQSGTADYAGKIADINMQGSPNLERHNFQTNHDGLGEREENGTDADPLCFLYYTDDGTVKRFDGPVVPSGAFGFQWARSKNSTGQVIHWNQNRNWVEDANGSNGTFDYNVSTVTGQFVSPIIDDVWWRVWLRLTLNEPGQANPGYGRVEVWMQRNGGPVFKHMEYIGDVGGFDEGLVDVSEQNAHWINASAAIHWCDLTGQNDPGAGGFYTGGNILTLGYCRCWSHPRPALP